MIKLWVLISLVLTLAKILCVRMYLCFWVSHMGQQSDILHWKAVLLLPVSSCHTPLVVHIISGPSVVP